MTANGKAGTYYRPTPIDFLLLEMMPEIGMIGGIHWKGRRARDLREQIIESGVDADLVSTTLVSARLRAMAVGELVKTFPTAASGGSQIWARTEKGTEFMATRDEVLGGAA